MSEETYFGVKQILVPDNQIYAGNLLTQCHQKVDDDRLLQAIKLFKDKPVVVIYTINDRWPKDDFIDCMFVGDYLRNVSDAKNISDTELVFKNHTVRLNQIVDVISQDHLNKNIPQNSVWKLYIFGVSDKKTDLYRIINVNPVLAYLDAEYNDNAPLKLYSIHDVHAGMQFNRGKGAGNIDDLY